MKDVRRKSSDPAVNQLLIKAYHQQDELIWDRMDAMQPQDGFARLGLSCTDCYEGPCRVNPFDPVDQHTACGRDKKDLAAVALLRRALNGAAALTGLARERGGKDLVDCSMADVMPGSADLACGLACAGKAAAAALSVLAPAKAEPATVQVNMGALKADAANIVLIGHVRPDFVAALRAAAKDANLLTVCGNEGLGLPLLTNYDSQETILLTGAVDLLVCGSQCVMPATVRLAEQLGVPMERLGFVDSFDAAAATAKAAAHQKARKNADVPAFSAQARTGYAAADMAKIAEVILAAKPKGLVYLGGCGNIKHTQDQDLVSLATQLQEAGYLLATGGCAGVALAKAGLCNADGGLPKAINLGACCDVSCLFELAKNLKGLPVFAALPELTQGKTLAVAVALGAGGIPTLISAAAMPGLDANDTGKLLLPVADFAQLPQMLASI